MKACQLLGLKVLPIHMGVILADAREVLEFYSTPHTHGGDSSEKYGFKKGDVVLPHTHGGDSITRQSATEKLKYSPYTWG